MPRLNFSEGDSDEYWNEKDALLDDLRDRLGPDADAEVVGDAGLLLDWTVNYGDGDLSRYSVQDLDEYLLEWCPRKVSAGPAGYLPIIAGAKEWITHLVLTDQWTGGPVQPLLKRLDKIVPEFLDAMSDPANFGMAKGMFMGPALSGADIDFNDPESLTAAMDAFNALPIEERRAATDQFMGPGSPHDMARGGPGPASGGPGGDPIQLPPTPSPDFEAAAAQASVAPLITQLAAVREYLGPKGVKLTATGNPKLVDAKALRDIFDTDDRWERGFPGNVRPVRSADELPHLQYLLAVAEGVGAIGSDGRTLSAEPGWESVEPLDRCSMLVNVATELGLTRTPFQGGAVSFFDAMAALLDVGALHLVVPAYLTGEVAYDEMLDLAVETVAGDLDGHLPKYIDENNLRVMVDQDLSRCMDILQRCGVVERVGAEMVQQPYSSSLVQAGGTVTMSDLGRLLMASILPTIGYQPNEPADLSNCSAAAAARALDSDPDAETGQVWAEWLPGADQADKVDQLLDALEGAEDPYQRLAVTALLSEADFDSRRRAEAIIDGPVAAYALMALDTELGGEPDEEDDRLNVLDPGPGVDDLPAVLSDGRSARQALAELPRSLSMLPILDMLWIQMMDDPDDLFATTVEFDTSGGTTFIEILDDLWRVDMPEAAELLEFLGREHPEKKVSKAARKALFRFRNAKV